MAAATTLLPLVRTHKKYLKLLLNIPISDHNYTYEALANAATTSTIHERYLYISASLLHDHIRYQTLHEDLTIFRNHLIYNTRNPNRYLVPMTRLSCRLRSFAFIMLNTYSELDPFEQTKSLFLKRAKKLIPRYLS